MREHSPGTAIQDKSGPTIEINDIDPEEDHQVDPSADTKYFFNNPHIRKGGAEGAGKKVVDCRICKCITR